MRIKSRVSHSKERIKDRFKNIKKHRFEDIIVLKRRAIETAFIIMVILCIFQIPGVKVNYDLTEYLPKEAESKRAIDLMEREFGYPGTARIMIEDVSIYEAFMYKQLIENVEGVDTVSWMLEDVYMTESFINMEEQKDYYRDRCAVMDITFDEKDSSPLTKKAVYEIRDMLGERGRLSGSAPETSSLEDTLDEEIHVIMVVAIVFISLILTLTTTSWLEPVLFLSIMGIAIVLNMGTNIFLGTISFLSKSIASVLQLATSMDYSVFLLHTYVRKKEDGGLDSEKAMSLAIKESAPSILSSAMTTFVGFIALCTMRFGLGKDVGLVLGKSIICSVMTVLFLMPALLLRFGDVIEKTKHRSFMPSFKGPAKLMCSLRYVVLVLMFVIAPFCYTAQNMNSFTFGNSALGRSPGTKVYEDTAVIEERFGRSNLYLMIVPNETPIKEKALCQELEDLYYVKSVRGMANTLPVGIPESIIPESISGKLRSRDYTRILIYTKTNTETDLAFETANEMKNIMHSFYPERSYLVGNTPSTEDLKNLMVPDYAKTNIVSLLAVGLVVAITFKSLILAVIVLIPICIATYINMTVPYLTGESFMFNGFMIVSCIQLGATVDYSILLTSSYLNEREHLFVPKKEAGENALAGCMLSILTSGIILTIAGYGIYYVSSVSAISSLGHLVGRGGLVSMLMVMLGIPALFSVADGIVFKEKEIMAPIITKVKGFMRKNLKRRTTGLMLVLILGFSWMIPSNAAAPAVLVDEGVFINLDYYGGVEEVNVVKTCTMNGNTTFSDYGDYTEVINMTNGAAPKSDGKKVSWDLSGYNCDTFYFEGRSSDLGAKLPWNIDVSYLLNGKSVKGEELAGASGVVSTIIKAVPDSSAPAYFRNNMVLVVSALVDMEKDNYSIEAPGSQLQTIGTKKTVIFMALPGEEGEFRINVGTKSYESPGIFFMMVPATFSSLDRINDIRDVKDTVRDSLNVMSDSADVMFDSLKGIRSSIIKTQDGLRSGLEAKKTVVEKREGVKNDTDELIASLSGVESSLSLLANQTQTEKKDFTEAMDRIDTLRKSIYDMDGILVDLEDASEDLEDSLYDLKKALKVPDEDVEGLKKIKEILAGYKAMGADISTGEVETAGLLGKLGLIATKISKDAGNAAGDTAELLHEITNLSQKTREVINEGNALNERITKEFKDHVIELMDLLEEFLINTKVSVKAGRQTISGMKELMDAAEGSIDAAVDNSLSGMIGMLDSVMGISDGSEVFRNAKDVMKDAVDDQLDEIEDDTNILNIDTSLEFPSFTSDKNPSPESIQVILRTREISIEDDDIITDIEPGPVEMTVTERIKAVIKKLFRL